MVNYKDFIWFLISLGWGILVYVLIFVYFWVIVNIWVIKFWVMKNILV